MASLSTRALAALVVAALVTLLVACGGDDGDEGPAEQPVEDEDFVSTLNPELADELQVLEGAPLYEIEARVDPEARVLAASQRLSFTNDGNDALGTLALRVYANAAFIGDGDNVEVISVESGGDPVDFDLDEALLTIDLDESVEPGDEVEVSLEFEQGIPELEGQSLLDLGGGDGNYGLYGEAEGILNLGHWHPVLIPAEEPSEGLPSTGDISNFDAALYEVSVTLPQDYELAAGGEEVDVDEVDGGLRHDYVAAAARDFALVVAEDFERLEEVRDGVTYRVHYRSDETDFRQAGRILDYAVGAVEVFTERFGPYVYRELDVAPMPLRGGAAGIEFSGLIGIGTSFYNGDPLGGFGGIFGQDGGEDSNSNLPDVLEDLLGTLSIDDLGSIFGGESGAIPGLADITEFVVAHEVAHQWWYNAVGSDSIDHPWMDESLANYSAVLYFADRYGDEAAAGQVEGQLVLPFRSMGILGGEDAVVDQPADAFDSATQYSGVVYGKGAFFFLELRDLAGDEAFFGGLGEYYATYRFQRAPNAAMVELIADRSSNAGDVDALYIRWIQEEHGEEDIGTITGLDDLVGSDGGLFDDLLGEAGDLLD